MMAMLDTPAFVVTTQVDGHPSGCLVAFATQTSVQPPSFMVGLPLGDPIHEVASKSDNLAVHVLPRSQHALAELFGREPDEQADPFARCAWRGGPLGMPILDDAAAWFVGRTLSRSESPTTLRTWWNRSPSGLRKAPRNCSTCPISTASTLGRKRRPGCTAETAQRRPANTACGSPSTCPSNWARANAKAPETAVLGCFCVCSRKLSRPG